MATVCVDNMLSHIDDDASTLYIRTISIDGLSDSFKDSILSTWAKCLFNNKDQNAINHALPFLLPLKSISIDENRYFIKLRYQFSRGTSLEAIISHHIAQGTNTDEETIVYIARVILADMVAGLQQNLIYGLSQRSVLVDQKYDKLVYTVYAPVTIINDDVSDVEDCTLIVNPINNKRLVEYGISRLGALLFDMCTLSSNSTNKRVVDPGSSSKYVARLCECGYSKPLVLFIITCFLFPQAINLAGENPLPLFNSFEDALSVINAIAKASTCSNSSTGITGSNNNTCSNITALNDTPLTPVSMVTPTSLYSETGTTQSSNDEQERNVIQSLIASRGIKSLTEHAATEPGSSILASILEDRLIQAKKKYSPELMTIVQACAIDKDLCIRINVREPEPSPIKTYLISAAQKNDAKAALKHYNELGFIHGKYTALMEAARRNNLRVIPILLGEIGYVNSAGQTALMLAAHFNNVEAVKLLLVEAGIADKWGTTALMMACMRGHDSVVEFLLPESQKQDEWGSTAMMYAAQRGHLSCVNLLLSKELKLVSKTSGTALSYAMMCGHKDCATMLQAERKVSNITPLMFSVFFNDRGDALKQYIDEHADTLFHANKAGFTAIMFAAAGHNWSAVDILLSYEAQHIPDMPDLRAKSVDEAACISFSEVVRKRYLHLVFVLATYLHYLLENGKIDMFKQRCSANVLYTWSGIPTTYRTGLMECAKRGDIIGVRAFQEDCCKVFNGYTALMLAIINHMVICSRLLLVEMGIQGSDGMTALMYAVDSGQIDLVALLLAEAPIQNSAGETALDIARRRAKGHSPDSPYSLCVSMLLSLQC